MVVEEEKIHGVLLLYDELSIILAPYEPMGYIVIEPFDI
jgi:hypothetical protein